MTRHVSIIVRQLLLRIFALAFGIVSASVIGAWLPTVGALLFILGLVIVPLILIILGAIATVQSSRLADLSRSAGGKLVAYFAPAIVTLFAFGMLLPTLWLGRFIGNESLLVGNLSHYRAIIARVQRAPSSAIAQSGTWIDDGRVTYIPDYGSPRRVAFEPAGFLDNWSGIVWDPTH